jgi:uncharacterized membrane protein YeaQ/YmgE (transglycosylase-associated protein family)
MLQRNISILAMAVEKRPAQAIHNEVPAARPPCEIPIESRHSRSPPGAPPRQGGDTVALQALIILIVVGAIAGWLAGQIVKGVGFGLAGNIVVGVVGAFIGTWVLGNLGIIIPGIIGFIIDATVGAVIALVIIGFIKRA